MRKALLTYKRQKGLYQSKVTSILASTQRQGHQAHNYKTDYYQCNNNSSTSQGTSSGSQKTNWSTSTMYALFHSRYSKRKPGRPKLMFYQYIAGLISKAYPPMPEEIYEARHKTGRNGENLWPTVVQLADDDDDDEQCINKSCIPKLRYSLCVLFS